MNDPQIITLTVLAVIVVLSLAVLGLSALMHSSQLSREEEEWLNRRQYANAGSGDWELDKEPRRDELDHPDTPSLDAPWWATR
jgi:hypothetical protein